MEATVFISNTRGFTDWLNQAVADQPGSDQAGKLGQRLGVKTPTINKWRQGKTQRLQIAYVSNIAKYLGSRWSTEDVTAWLGSPDGTPIAEFKENHDFRSKEEDPPSIGGRVQEILKSIQSLYTTNGVSSEEKLAIITAVVIPPTEETIEDEEEQTFPPAWVEVVNAFPKSQLSSLYSLGRDIVNWKESIDRVIALKQLPDSAIISAMCLLINLNTQGKKDFRPEHIEQILESYRDSIQPESKEPFAKGST
jgi:transcriptional regulator with XRE-family HTH domain